MVQSILEILLRTKGGTQTKAELGKVQKSVNALTGAAAQLGLMLGLAGVTGALVMFGKASIQAARKLEVATSNMEFSVKAARREFGAAMGTTEDWTQTVEELSESLGVFSREEVATASARLIDMTKRLGFTADEMEVMLYRTADLSAGKVDLSSGIERVSAAMRGEAESAEYLGLSLNEMQVRAYAEAHGEVWKELTDVEKAGQRYLLFLEQTEEMMGRATDYADTQTGKVEALTVAWGEFQAEFGEFLVAGGVIEALTKVATLLKEGAQAWQDAIARREAGGEVAKAQRLATWSTVGAVATLGAAAAIPGSVEWLATQYAQLAQTTGIVTLDAEELTGQLDEMSQVEEEAAIAAKENAAAQTDSAEANKAAAEAAGARADAVGAYADYAKEAVRLEKDYAQQRQDTVDEYGKRRVEMEQSYASQREQALEDFTKQQGRQLRNYQRQEQQAEQAYYDRRQDSAEAFSEQIAQMEADHQKKMGRMREDYDMRQEDAVGNRDALAFLRNQRQYEVQRRRAEEDYGDAASQRSTEYGRQLADQEEQFVKQREQRQADFELRTTDQQADFDQRREREAEQHQEMMAQYDTDHQDRLADMQTAFADEKLARDDAFADELADQGVWLGSWSRQWREGEAQLEEDYTAFLGRMRNITTGGTSISQAAGMVGSGGVTGGSFVNSPSFTVNEATTPPAALVAMIQAQINTSLVQYERGR